MKRRKLSCHTTRKRKRCKRPTVCVVEETDLLKQLNAFTPLATVLQNMVVSYFKHRTLYFTESACIRALNLSNHSMYTLVGHPDERKHVDGYGSTARFINPCSLAFDPTSRVLFVGDFNCVRRVTLDGEATTVATREDWQDGEDEEDGFIEGVAVLGPNLFFADPANNAIRFIALNGQGPVQVHMCAGLHCDFTDPTRLVSTRQDLFVLQGEFDTLHCVTQSTEIQEVNTVFMRLNGFAFDGDRIVFTTSTGQWKDTVHEVSYSTGKLKRLASGAFCPQVLSIDSFGRACVADFEVRNWDMLKFEYELQFLIRLVAPDGSVSTLHRTASRWCHIDMIASVFV